MKDFIVSVDIEICDKVINEFITVKAENKEQAYLKALECIKATFDIKVEKKPIESL